MNIIQVAFNAIAPTFLYVVAGYFCKCVGVIHENEQPRMNSIGFKVFLPLMLFYEIYSSEIPYGQGVDVLIFNVIAIFCVYGLVCLFVLRVEKEGRRRGVMTQAIFRSNYVLLGLPIVTALYPEAAGVVSLSIAFAVPIFNMLAVIALEMFNGSHTGLGSVLRNIGKNPLIIASLLGMLFMFTGLRLPLFLEKACAKFSGIATPYLLFWLGCFFRVRFRFDRALFYCLSGRLLVVPAIVLTIAAWMGFRNGEFATVMALFATPTATSSFTMAQQLDGDAELAGNTVVLGCALSFFTILGWLCLFMALGIL